MAEKSTEQSWKCGEHGELQSGEEVVWGQSQRRVEKRRGVQLCKIANHRLTQRPAMQRCSDVTYTEPLAYISC